MGKKLDKLKEELDKPLWLNRIAYYSLIFLSVLGLFAIVLAIFYIIVPDFSISGSSTFAQYNATELSNKGFYDNERYLLSALVQSLAAVIALVITLSLVAVQLAAQSYSPRVISVYKNNPDLWILLCTYILTIFYSLGLIKIVELGIPGFNIEIAIIIAYFLGLFAFIFLIPYMLKTLDLLRPSSVITLLAIDITKTNIIESFDNEDDINENDPVQPIIDMINGALERNDYETVRNGLKAIVKYSHPIFEEKITLEEKANISDFLFMHILRIADTAFKNGNYTSTSFSINSLAKLGILFVNSNVNVNVLIQQLNRLSIELGRSNPNFIGKFIEHIGEFAKECLDRDLEKETEILVNMVKNLGTIAINNNKENDSTKAIIILSDICKISLEKHEDTANIAIEGLKVIGDKAAGHHFTNTVCLTIKNLKEIGHMSIGYKKEENIDDIAASLIRILDKIVRDYEEETINNSIEAFFDFAQEATDNEMISEKLTTNICKLGDIVSRHKPERSTYVLEEIGTIGLKTANKSNNIPNTIIEQIGKIGIHSALYNRTHPDDKRDLYNTAKESSLNWLEKIRNNAQSNSISRKLAYVKIRDIKNAR